MPARVPFGPMNFSIEGCVLYLIGLVIRCAPLARPPRTRLGWRLVRMTNRVAQAALSAAMLASGLGIIAMTAIMLIERPTRTAG